MKILFVGLRNMNHSSAGGYDKIANMPNTHSISSNSYPFSNIPLGKLKDKGCMVFIKKILRRVNVWIPHFLSHFYRWNYDITHLYYGEFVIPFWLYLKSKRHKVVTTIHLNIDSYRFPWLYVFFFKKLDGIVVLSSQQEKLLKQKYGLKTTFIPHGFSKPIYTHKEPLDCTGQQLDKSKINLFVAGSNYRDIHLLKNIVDYSAKRNLSICYHLVGMPINVKEDLSVFDNVRIYNRLSDDEYFSLLSICDYTFLPLLFATANNVLLESQFIGKSSILPMIEGIIDYAAPTPLNMFYTSYEDLCSLFLSLNKPEKQECVELQVYAKKFEWSNIYTQLRKYYETL